MVRQYWWAFAPAAGFLIGGKYGFVVGLGFNVLVWICRSLYDELSQEKE
jgi:hypothetical protein